MSRPVRVLQVVLSLTIGGAEKMVCDIVRQIDGVTSVVCCLNELGAFGEELRRDGFQVYVLDRKPGIDWSVVRELTAIIRQEKIDVVNAQQYTPYFYALLATLGQRLTALSGFPKIIFTEHGIPYPYKKKLKRLLLNPVLCSFADEITTISEYTRSLLAQYENFPARRTKVIYNGVAIDRFSNVENPELKKRSLGMPANSKVIGIVARLDAVKNHPMLLRAFRRVVAELPGTNLVIVGDGPENRDLQGLASSLGISDSVLFLGARTDIAELLHTFDLFVLPSFSEGMSITLIEAMSAGLPVVATNVGGNPEVVNHGETGYLVENDNEQELARRLIECLRDDELRLKMGEAAKLRARKLFSLDRMINCYRELYLQFSAGGATSDSRLTPGRAGFVRGPRG